MSGDAGGSGPQVSVDISELNRLAGELGAFTNEDVRAEAQAARWALSAGVPFGHSTISSYVRAAAKRYEQNLIRVIDTLHEYAQDAETIAADVRTAAAGYRDADLAAASRVDGTGISPDFVGPVAPVWVDTRQQPAPVVAGPVRAPQNTVAAGFEPFEQRCVNWAAWDMQGLWDSVAPDDVSEAGAQEAAWRRVTSALDTQVRSLRQRRDAVARAWPPHEGSASAEALRRFDRLIVSMTQAAQAASTTTSAIGRVNEAVASAQRDVRALYTEFQEKSHDIVIRQIDGAEDELTDRARARLAAAEREIRSAAEPMQAVPEYKAGPSRKPPEDDTGGPIGTGGVGGSGQQPASAVVPTLRHTPPAPLPGVDPTLPDGSEWTPTGAGPQLSGVGPATLTPPGTQPITPGLPGPGGLPGTGAPPPGTLPSGGVPSGGWAPIGMPGGGVPRSGIIGGRPMRGTSGGRPPAGVQSGRPVGPGGVIGANPSSGRAGAAGVAPVAGQAGRGGARDDEQVVLGGGADTEWGVAEGVAPVIGAGGGREGRHDLGSGVIGIDR